MSGCATLLIDCDALTKLIAHCRLDHELLQALLRLGSTLTTLDKVHQRELRSPVREWFDHNVFHIVIGEILPTPFGDSGLDRPSRKLLKRLERRAKNNKASNNDKGLLFHAIQSGSYLISDDKEVHRLANDMNHDAILFGFDVVDALARTTEITPDDRDRCLALYPSPSEPTPRDHADARGGPDRADFDCLDASPEDSEE